ncbi:MAG: 2OG-Fe(II) oxygenase [Cyclobacteriaceae bacterium]|nr:2OG-Fe(II) oxygenase [Cyclobacteriaceae bacterium]
MNYISEQQWIDWVDNLSLDDYLIIDEFISDTLYDKIKVFLLDKLQEDAFAKAGIGALAAHQVNSEIRTDFVYWLDKVRDTALEELFDLIITFKSKLNELCFLSLGGYEFHLAHYPKGSFYKKHLDQFKGRNNRLITLIIYFNDQWEPGDGGELRIFREGKSELVVAPIARRAVIFKSNIIEHEVLMANKSRYSLTGWLLYQPTSVGYLLG